MARPYRLFNYLYRAIQFSLRLAMKMRIVSLAAALLIVGTSVAQDAPPIKPDSIHLAIPMDTVVVEPPLRIINLNPFFTVHVDSIINYDLKINKEPTQYYWYLKNAPVGVKLDRNTGNLYFKAEKSFFKSGRLKYDEPYRILMGVQNLENPEDNVDTSFTIVFYNTEIVAPKVKPTVSNVLYVEEGDSIRFRVQCEQGSFPVEQVTMLSNMPISNYQAVKKCDDEFRWMVPYDFIRDGDTAKQKTLVLNFVSSDKFFNRDTAEVRVIVRPGIDYPLQYLIHKKASDECEQYVAKLKLAFYQLSRNVKKTKNTRTTFDITSSSAALAGTVANTTGTTEGAKNMGKILPSIGLTLVPVKEAVSPNKVQEQNAATQVRSVVKRLEYLVSDNALVGDKDPNVLAKTKKLQDELKEARRQLFELPINDFEGNVSKEDADRFFKDPKVNKNYRIKMK